MTDEELRLECLRIAAALRVVGAGDLMEVARTFYELVRPKPLAMPEMIGNVTEEEWHANPKVRAVMHLNMPYRGVKAMKKYGIMTIGDVIEYTERQLLAIPGFGVRSLTMLKDSLGELGLKLTTWETI